VNTIQTLNRNKTLDEIPLVKDILENMINLKRGWGFIETNTEKA
jgi:hypothetical protein